VSTLGTRFRAIRLFAALLILNAPAYAADKPETFKCSARGGPEWREYRSKHFLLDTDLSRDSAALQIKDLERLYAMVLQAMIGEQVELPGRSRVIGFGNQAQFQESGKDYAGYHTITPLQQSLIVIPVGGLKANPETVAHELVHHLSWFLFARQPRWFSEGLAQFIQTVASEMIGNEPTMRTGSHMVRGATHLQGGVGVIPQEARYALAQTAPVKMKELLTWRGLEGAEAERAYYVQSWLLYHWLWNNRSKGFTEFQGRLSAAEDPSSAWRASFPDFDPLKPGTLESLDKALERYRNSARYVFYRVNGEGDATFVESKLPPAEVHLLLVQLRLIGAKAEERESLLRAELDEALREDPTHPVAIARRAKLENISPLERLRSSVSARPNDARGWLFLARALAEAGNQMEAERAYRKAIALDSESADAHNGLAALLAAKGQNKEALPLANRAVDLAPWDPACIDTLAAVAAGLGKCAEALVLQRRAVSLIDAARNPISLAAIAGEDAFTKRLREYEARCAPSASK
jgi:tetratricopeptide (TPR) repeat protein